jgi:hypothetical protein
MASSILELSLPSGTDSSPPIPFLKALADFAPNLVGGPNFMKTKLVITTVMHLDILFGSRLSDAFKYFLYWA